MIAFLTLFLGLVVGRHAVAVAVTPGIRAVDVLLDGKQIGRTTGPPWTVAVDFGHDLLPHELVARALASDGLEIARVRQFINLPRPSVEVEVLLERDEDGRAIAGRYTFETVGAPDKAEAAVTFDGARVRASDDGHFKLPPYDAVKPHLLSVAIDFPNGVRSQKVIALRGGPAEEGKSELTAIPLRNSSPSTPTVAGLTGHLFDRSEPLVPVAVEHGPACLVLVREASREETFRKLGDGGRDMRDPFRGGFLVHDPEASRHEMSLDDDDEIRFIWPIAESVRSTAMTNLLFDKSRKFLGKEAGLHWLLTRISHPAEPALAQRFADAVAVAGLQAYASRSRRAVLVILDTPRADASRESPADVRRYLEALRVPLRVWSADPVTPSSIAAWRDVEDVSTPAKLRVAAARLKRDLQTQSMVWVEGEHLPDAISLADAREGSFLLR